MQRNFAVTSIKLHKLLLPTSPAPRFLATRGCRTDSRAVGRTRDPEEPEEIYDKSDTVMPATSGDELAPESSQNNDPYEPTKNPVLQSNPRIKRSAVNPPPDPFTQQKRSSSTTLTEQTDDIVCVGFDGSPLPEDENGGHDHGRGRRRKEAEEDDKDYFKHHKASPLSELKIADTRKPITRATDGSADSKHGDHGGGGVVVWRPEQVDTAEDSLRRATEIWKQNAMRGDPESPHGRALREMRGEYW